MRKLLQIFGLWKKQIPIRVSVFIERDGDVFYAYSPTMPGLHVEGNTEDEVEKNVRDAVLAYLLSLIKHNDPLPIAMPVNEMPHAKTYTFTQKLPAFAW